MKTLLFIFALTLTTTTFARGGVCRQEIEQLCSQHRGDRTAMRQCIEENHSKLSEQCQEKMKNRKKMGKRRAQKNNDV